MYLGATPAGASTVPAGESITTAASGPDDLPASQAARVATKLNTTTEANFMMIRKAIARPTAAVDNHTMSAGYDGVQALLAGLHGVPGPKP